MPRNVSGVYSLPSGNPVTTLTTISASWANSTLSDIATELTNSIDKGGRTAPSANLPMAGFKHTGAGDGAATGEYLVYGQVLPTTGVGSAPTTNGKLFVYQDDASIPTCTVRQDGAGDIMRWMSGASVAARVDSTGKVALGTATFAAKFTSAVSGAAGDLSSYSLTPIVAKTGSSSDAVNTRTVFVGQSYTPGTTNLSDVQIALANHNSSTSKAAAVALLADGSLFFSTGNYQNDLTLWGTERMRIDSGGNFVPKLTSSAPSLASNLQMVFNLTSNTNLRISVRGSDGITRVANITLA